MNAQWAMSAAAAVGAGLMYFADPRMGRRRRALVGDKLIRARRVFNRGARMTSCDLTNRARGLMGEMHAFLKSEEVSDEVLEARVRAELGFLVSHPGAVEVTVARGHVTLSGTVLASEVKRLLKGVASVRGVTRVDNRLERHKEPWNVPALQGGPPRPAAGRRFELMQVHWSPGARLLAGSMGAALAIYGGRRRGAVGTVLGGSGMVLLLRALTDLELKRLVGAGAGRRAIDVQKTIELNAPVERVFQLWADYAHFPRFMSHVKEVKDLGNGRSRWTVAGPAGVPVEWDAAISAYIPDEVLAWRSEPNALIQHAGIVRFQPNTEGGTTVDVRLSYNPGIGGVGHALATLFGADPKRRLDDDLLRMKTFIETGKAPSDAAAPWNSRGATAHATMGGHPNDGNGGGEKMAPHSGKPDINTASKEELIRAPGIGEGLADEIIRNRPYHSAADLERLALIGEKRIEQLRESLTIPNPS
jgi:uncharacterized membrane protein